MASGVYARLKSILRRGCIFIHPSDERLLKEISLPEEFLDDLRSFSERNSLAKLGADINCGRCLKAYALMRAREMQIDYMIIAPLIMAMDCEAGHNGYYEDGNHIIAVSN